MSSGPSRCSANSWSVRPTPSIGTTCTPTFNLCCTGPDVFASALDEYDQACQHHDAEMDSIRVAFMAKWGQVPVLELYRQMAIRQQKAKDFEQALWWAERGLAIYGTDCARTGSR